MAKNPEPPTLAFSDARPSAVPVADPRRPSASSLPARSVVTEAGHADGCHAAGRGRLDAARGVLYHEADIRRQPELFRRCEKDHWVWLAARKISTGDVRVEQLRQGPPVMNE
jgi:hypothetical protein